MAVVIDMPKLSDTMEEGVIVKWNVKEGDSVSSGDIIAEVETDKATMDVEVFDGGTVLKILAQEGDAIPLGGKIAIIGEKGEDIAGLIEGGEQKETKTEPAEEKKAPAEKAGSKKDFDPLFGDLNGVDKSAKKSVSQEDGRIKASPLARKMAQEEGIDIHKVQGSGPNGRIIKRDIESYDDSASTSVSAPAASAPVSTAVSQDIKISQMRKTIARRLAESKFTSPHYYETIDIDMRNVVQTRAKLNDISEVKISFNDFVIKACSVALKQHPAINSSWLDDIIRQHGDIHIAMAVAIDDGLITPVIRNVDQKGLQQIAKESKELAGKARDRKLQPEEWEGSTFSVSNLGMFGIDEFTAIINPPNACILAIGSIRDVPIVDNGEIVPGKQMKVTLSSDHRVVDGAQAASFLGTLKNLLENPMGMLL